jgi:hypothetical protein
MTSQRTNLRARASHGQADKKRSFEMRCRSWQERKTLCWVDDNKLEREGLILQRVSTE